MFSYENKLAYNLCMQIDIDLIQAGQWTERLLQSDIRLQEIERARLYGLYDDVHVRALEHQPGHYEILGSPKTWLIAQLIQQPSVPVKQMDHLSTSELNGYYIPIKTTPDHFIDRARELYSLIKDQNLSLTKAGKMIGKSRSEVCNLMRILKIDEAILGQIKSHSDIGFGHAKIMAGLQHEQQTILLGRITNERLTVQQAEVVARDLRENREAVSVKNSTREKTADVLRLETMLTEHFGARVEINEKDGFLEINYHHDLDILQGVLEKIGIADL